MAKFYKEKKLLDKNLNSIQRLQDSFLDDFLKAHSDETENNYSNKERQELVDKFINLTPYMSVLSRQIYSFPEIIKRTNLSSLPGAATSYEIPGNPLALRARITDDNNSSTEALNPINEVTLSYSEDTKGWTSFKSFFPEEGLSVGGNYYTFKDGRPYVHHSNNNYNEFYGKFEQTTLTALLNDSSGSVKSYTTLNYEGTQSKIDEFIRPWKHGTQWNDGEYYNLESKEGWYVEDIVTDLQEGSIPEFIEKEGKYFNFIKGIPSELSNIDPREFSYQGLARIYNIIVPPGPPVYENYLLVADILDSDYLNDGGFMVQKNFLDGCHAGTITAPWINPNGYIHTSFTSIPGSVPNPFGAAQHWTTHSYFVVGSITNNIPSNELHSDNFNLTKKLTVVPYYERSSNLGCVVFKIPASDLGVGRMFTKFCETVDPNTGVVSFNTYISPYFEIEPQGVVAAHGEGHTEYEIRPLTDEAGLGFNYFSKPGWPSYLKSHEDDIYITKIHIREVYTLTQARHHNYPARININCDITDYQMDSTVNSIGQPTPMGNRYIPVDIDVLINRTLPQPLTNFIISFGSNPYNGTYLPGSDQQVYPGDYSPPNNNIYTWPGPTTEIGGAVMSFEMEYNLSSNSDTGGFWGGGLGNLNTSTDVPVQIPTADDSRRYAYMCMRSPVLAGEEISTLYIEMDTFCKSFSDTAVELVDGMFAQQLLFSDDLVNLPQVMSTSVQGTVGGYTHESNLFNNSPGFSSTFHQRDYFNSITATEDYWINQIPTANKDNASPNYFYMAFGTSSYIQPLHDQWFDLGKVYHDLNDVPTPPVYGCTDGSPNIPNLKTPAGCGYGCFGALNMNPNATIDDGSCIYCVYGCTDPTASNYDPNATCDDGSCIAIIYGCTSIYAVNYDPSATADDGSCIWEYCNDPLATNYNRLCVNNMYIPTLQGMGINLYNLVPSPCCGLPPLDPCNDLGTFADQNWGTTWSVQTGIQDAYITIVGTPLWQVGGAYISTLPMADQTAWDAWFDTHLGCQPGTSSRIMDITWIMVWSKTQDNNWKNYASSTVNCTLNPWTGSNYGYDDGPEIYTGNPNPADNYIDFFGGIRPTDFDVLSFPDVAQGGWACHIAAITIPGLVNPHDYMVTIEIDRNNSYLEAGAVLKIGYGDPSTDYSVPFPPTAGIHPTNVSTIGYSANYEVESFIEGELSWTDNNYTNAIETHVFGTFLNYTPNYPDPMLVFTFFANDNSYLRISNIKIECKVAGPPGPGAGF